jgi:hypothetical protein
MSDDYLKKGESLKQMEARNFKNYKGASDMLEKKRGEIKKDYGPQVRTMLFTSPEAKQRYLKSQALEKAKGPSIDKKEYKGITKLMKNAIKD